MPLISSKQDLMEQFEAQQYLASPEVIYTVYNAIQLNMPILIEGPAGVGKTELAKVLHQAFNLEFLRIQCYEGIDFSKVLYDYHYPKQMITINALQGKINEELEGLSINESINHFGDDTNFFDERFLLKRPLLQAIDGDQKKVLLIDEIDKSDEEFEALLLEFLGEFSVTIPEFKTVTCNPAAKPIVILTSNAKRELSEALKRRCLYLYIDYPTESMEASIIQAKAQVDEAFATKVAKVVNNIRSISNLKQRPSIAESITWAQALLINLGEMAFDLDHRNELNLTLNSLIKNKRDLEVVKSQDYLKGVEGL